MKTSADFVEDCSPAYVTGAKCKIEPYPMALRERRLADRGSQHAGCRRLLVFGG
jgi:hypothetical protein